MIKSKIKLLTKIKKKLYRIILNWMISENIINFNLQILIFLIVNCQYIIMKNFINNINQNKQSPKVQHQSDFQKFDQKKNQNISRN